MRLGIIIDVCVCVQLVRLVLRCDCCQSQILQLLCVIDFCVVVSYVCALSKASVVFDRQTTG